MKESMQNTSMPNQEEFAAADADRMLLLEALSAWMDGEALPAGVDEHAVLQWLLQDTHAQETWRSWHAHADCLRARAFVTDAIDASRAARQKHDAAVGSVAWSESLRQRLAQLEQRPVERRQQRRLPGCRLWKLTCGWGDSPGL